MKKKKAEPKASQPSSSANVVLCGWRSPKTWHYVEANSWSATSWSRAFKTKEAAISAAVKAGFKKVRCEGQIVASRPAEIKPIEAYADEADREGVRSLDDQDLLDLRAICTSLHSQAIADEIDKEIVRRKLVLAVKVPVTGS